MVSLHDKYLSVRKSFHNLSRNSPMSCEQVPVIDLCLARNGLSESAYIKIRNACEEWGCFVVVNHGIKEEIIDQMESAARDMFKLPTETKEKNKFARRDWGYVSTIPAFPFLEVLGIPGPSDRLAIQNFSNQLWPQGNPKIREIIEAYACCVEELTIGIIKVILRSFRVCKYYSTCKFWGLLRMNYCNLPPQEKGGLAAHTDHNCITVVYQDNTGGLEIQNSAGNWVDVKPEANSFVVFMGDSFKAWSNGRIHSVLHRVICQSSRVSMPFFYFFTDETVIDAPREFVDEEHPRLYKPFIYADYRDYCKGKRGVQLQHRKNFLRETEEAHLDNFASVSKS